MARVGGRKLAGVKPLRTLISLVALAGALWIAFTVKLGPKTFAEHVDSIGATPEAQQLLEGTRDAVNPKLGDVKDRVLGEYVEAPTWIPDERGAPLTGDEAPPKPEQTHASTAGQTKLPGRR